MVSRRLILLLTVLVLAAAQTAGSAEIAWKQETEGQRLLKSYVESANGFLTEQGEQPINSLFEMQKSFAVFGITDQPDAEVPEAVDITASLFYNSINSLQVRVSYTERFPRIAAAFLCALSPETMTLKEALETPTKRAKQALSAPTDSFEDPVEPLNGTVPYIYYAYYPNQYSNGVSWIQMTIIFPMEGFWDGNGMANGETETRAPDTYSDFSSDYEGYFSEDDYSHLEVFETATPEPDSAAGDGFSYP